MRIVLFVVCRLIICFGSRSQITNSSSNPKHTKQNVNSTFNKKTVKHCLETILLFFVSVWEKEWKKVKKETGNGETKDDKNPPKLLWCILFSHKKCGRKWECKQMWWCLSQPDSTPSASFFTPSPPFPSSFPPQLKNKMTVRVLQTRNAFLDLSACLPL